MQTALQCAALTLFMQIRFTMYGTETLFIQTRFTMCGTETLFNNSLRITEGCCYIKKEMMIWLNGAYIMQHRNSVR